jgi:hypothetical protein
MVLVARRFALTSRSIPLVPISRFSSILLVPFGLVLVVWAGCAVVSALDFPADDPCADEALPLVVDYNRQEWALHEQQRKATTPAERERIAEERKALLERMRLEVGEIYRRHGREWNQKLPPWK